MVRKYHYFCRFELENISIYKILAALGLTQFVHDKISIGMQHGVRFYIFIKIFFLGLETRFLLINYSQTYKTINTNCLKHEIIYCSPY